MTQPNPPSTDDPLDEFSDCHATIFNRLAALEEVLTLAEAASRARRLAGELLAFFDDVVEQHHADEELELIPALLAAAEPGDEAAQAKSQAERIISEHRALEIQWGGIRPNLKRIVKGQEAVELAADDVARLVTDYRAHADFEETDFLPLAKRILSRKSDELAALGLSLHIRRHKLNLVVPYV
jgi:hemerythrin-like domain-containing protein